MELFKCLIPMILAAIFVLTAAMFASMGIQKKENRKIGFTGATFIELISFTIWIPNLNDLFRIIGFGDNTIQVAMIVSVILILLATVLATIFYLKHEKI